MKSNRVIEVMGGHIGSPKMRTGIVKFFRDDRGYGFIKPDDGAADVFMHVTAMRQAGLETLHPGERVSFDTRPDRFGKGPLAIDLAVIRT